MTPTRTPPWWAQSLRSPTPTDPPKNSRETPWTGSLEEPLLQKEEATSHPGRQAPHTQVSTTTHPHTRIPVQGVHGILRIQKEGCTTDPQHYTPPESIQTKTLPKCQFPWQKVKQPTQGQASLNHIDNDITIIGSFESLLDSNNITFNLDSDLDCVQINNCVYPLECQLDVPIDSTPCLSVQTYSKQNRDIPDHDNNMVSTSLCHSFENMNINNVNTNNTTPTDTHTSVLKWDKGTRVLNLSDHQLTDSEFSLLERNLTFVPIKFQQFHWFLFIWSFHFLESRSSVTLHLIGGLGHYGKQRINMKLWKYWWKIRSTNEYTWHKNT